MKRGRYVLWLSMVLLLLSSCGGMRQVAFTGIKGVKMKSASRAELLVGLCNDSGRELVLRSAELELSLPGTVTVTLTMPAEVTVGGPGEQTVSVPLRVRCSNPLAAVALVPVLGERAGEVTVSGEIRAKMRGGIALRKRVREMPLPEFLEMCGVSAGDIFGRP